MRWRGIDVSHHTGAIDWKRVRRDGIRFAWVKASEGSSFTDPRFAENVAAARASAVRVGGYHYFSTCSAGEPQARHFVSVLRGAGRTSWPPAIDLELLGNCPSPPPRDQLLREVRGFIGTVEEATGARMVVYLYPDFERRYRFAAALDRRQWVRRLGSTPPRREWWAWQRSEVARIDGISVPVDLNIVRRPAVPPGDLPAKR